VATPETPVRQSDPNLSADQALDTEPCRDDPLRANWSRDIRVTCQGCWRTSINTGPAAWHVLTALHVVEIRYEVHFAYVPFDLCGPGG
jgi:hypothetical protein